MESYFSESWWKWRKSLTFSHNLYKAITLCQLFYLYSVNVLYSEIQFVTNLFFFNIFLTCIISLVITDRHFRNVGIIVTTFFSLLRWCVCVQKVCFNFILFVDHLDDMRIIISYFDDVITIFLVHKLAFTTFKTLHFEKFWSKKSHGKSQDK